MSEYRHGKHTWRENWSDDPETNKDWYAALLGWKLDPQDMGDFVYNMFACGEVALGGFAQLQPEMKAMGAPPHWLTYISVADVDATCTKVTAAGGQLLGEAFDIPNVGRIAIAMDNQGAVFALFKGTDSDPDAHEPPPPHGDHWWTELMAPDAAKARAFYTEVIGWSVETMPMPTGEYTVFLTGPEKPSCGLMAIPEGVQAPAHWGVYFAVEDIDATAAKATETGGTIHNGPMDAQGVGRFAQVADPQGAVFGIITPDLSRAQ